MRILKIDKKENLLQVVPEIEDDLWHLERIIEKHDIVSGTADRKIKPKEAGEKPIRIKLSVSLKVENLEFHRFIGQLRASGTILEGKPADKIEIGAQQALEIELGKDIKIKKARLKQFQIDRLKKAAEATKQGKTILVVMDDEQANIAVLREFELEEISSIRSHKSGKQFKGEETDTGYFKEIMAKLEEMKPEKVVIAGPGFTKENLQKHLKEKGKPKGTQFFFASTNSIGKTGLQELLKGDTLEKMTQEMQLVKETKLVEKILEELGKNSSLAEYGLKEVENAVSLGAVKSLVVADQFLLEKRDEAEQVMKQAENSGAEIHLVNAEHEAGKQLVNLGGIAAILRYKIQ